MKFVIDFPEEKMEQIYDICNKDLDIPLGLQNTMIMAICNGKKQTNTEKIISKIDFSINATDSNDDYSVGLRNGMRLVKSLLDNKEPKFEKINQTNTAELPPKYNKDDLIHRETARRIIDSPRSKEQMLMMLASIPKVENTAEWILCKDRLPELTKYGYTDVSAEGYTIEEWESEEVLISYCINGKTNECVAFLQKVIFSDTGGIEYDWITDPFGESDSIYAGISTDDVKESVKVIAWQPLPTPPIAE